MSLSILKPGHLHRIRALARLDESQLEAFMEFVTVVTFGPLERVVKQGDPGDSMFLILEGKMNVYALSHAGTENEVRRFLRTLEAGHSFGEIALMNQIPRTATVEAATDSMLISITSAALQKLVETHPAVAAKFLYLLARNLGLQLADTSARLRSFWEQDGVLGTVP